MPHGFDRRGLSSTRNQRILLLAATKGVDDIPISTNRGGTVADGGARDWGSLTARPGRMVD